MRRNVNVGVMGHIDAGKTALVEVLSSVFSTASRDKHPESQARGITIDLGFSSFEMESPGGLMQFTLVDCPGHASLVKTVIGAAQIVDVVLLVIDAAKGIQAQTAESIVLAEILTDKMVVAINKVDLVSEKDLIKFRKRLLKTLNNTKFFDAPIVECSALRRDVASLPQILLSIGNKINVNSCKEKEVGLLVSIDHCFPIRGKGTVLTGNILKGSVRIGDFIEIPGHNGAWKVKSLHRFHESVDFASKNDRVGVCIAGFPSHSLERGWMVHSASDVLSSAEMIIAKIKQVRFYKDAIHSKQKFHISVGHSTRVASAIFFGMDGDRFDWNGEFLFHDSFMDDSIVALKFEKPLFIPRGGILIASDLSKDPSKFKGCRLAFSGIVMDSSATWRRLSMYRKKTRTGWIDRIVNSRIIIVRDVLGKTPDISPYIGKMIMLSNGHAGIISSSFGKAGNGKCKVEFQYDLPMIMVNGKQQIALEDTSVSLDILKFI